MVLKAFPQLKVEHAEKVEAFGADKVFILDIAMADQEFHMVSGFCSGF